MRTLTRSGCAAASRRASLPPTKRSPCAGARTSSAPIWSATCHSWGHVSQPRRCGACGRCSPTSRADLNTAELARNLGVSGKTVAHYLDLMVDLLLVRRLQPHLASAGKRLVRSPKVYVRDSGLLHALLGIAGKEALLGHPVVGASWEGLAMGTSSRSRARNARRASTEPAVAPGRPCTHLARRRNMGDRGQAQPGAKARTRLPLELGRPETHPQLRRLRGPRALFGGAEDRGDRSR